MELLCAIYRRIARHHPLTNRGNRTGAIAQNSADARFGWQQYVLVTSRGGEPPTQEPGVGV